MTSKRHGTERMERLQTLEPTHGRRLVAGIVLSPGPGVASPVQDPPAARTKAYSSRPVWRGPSRRAYHGSCQELE